MSLRRDTPGPTTAGGTTVSSSRLRAVLRTGLCNLSDLPFAFKDGEYKYVEFEPDLPKDAAIPRNCVSVPWNHYAPKKELETPIHYFLLDVITDRRLGDMKYRINNPTSNPEVQRKALAQHKWGVGNSNFADESTVWIMDFVETDDFRRYCLIPEDSMSLLERLQKALAHLDSSMTPLNMRNTKRMSAKDEEDDAPAVEEKMNQQSVEFKAFFIDVLNKQLEALKKL